MNLLYFTKLKETFHWNGNKSEHVIHSHAMQYTMLSYTMPNVQAQGTASFIKSIDEKENNNVHECHHQ